MKDRRASRPHRVRLAAGRRLQRGHILTGAGGSVQLNESAAAILSLCDGRLTRDQIIARMLRRLGDDSFAADLREFLDAARRRRWIVER